ncbi:MAG TPA: glycerate kinase [Planctomycetota bacterium]|nr:glycerate kinase [Planctomycetota bacterium]
MKIVVAPDSFKECLAAREVAAALARGVRDILPDAEVVSVPMADGGEGTVEALVDATDGGYVERDVTGPMGRKVRARFGVLGDGTTAVIEMASASGLPLVAPGERNPLTATTFGTGELISAALDHDVRKVLIGIGGSATVDGGAGMAEALGVRLLDADGNDLAPGGGTLGRLARIDVSGLDPRVRSVTVEVACDVDNPLTGETGAARVYGPQKGATPEQVDVLDAALGRLAEVIERDLGVTVASLPGSGAAGGLGAGLVAFLGATLRPGVDMVVDAVGLAATVTGADLVITGEGRLDRQSAFGKTPVGVAQTAKKLGIPVVAIVGAVGEGAHEVLTHGIDAFFSIQDGPATLEETFRDAPALLRRTAEHVTRLFLLGRAGRPLKPPG